ncbi:MAG: PAS domain S-box protein [Leptolyngbyaceae cyanobacterium SL_7_1]|nr:PAS domain S-box protein [Leptolyngbyaceae cyanobacterium SL_7_1]
MIPPYLRKIVMEQLRVAIDTLQTKERYALVQSDRQLTQLQNLTTATLWFSSLASVVGYLAALYLFSNLDWELQDRKLQLQESQAFLKAVTANVVDGVITLDREGKIETLNHAAEAMFGYKAEEVIGNPLTFLLAEPLSQSSNTDLTSSHIPLGQTIQSQGQRKVGAAAFPVEMSISELQLDDDFIVIIRDITERQAAEKNLADRADELARLNILLAKTNTMIEDRNRELDKFAYVASHDLKAPLRAIANLSEWIEEDLIGEIPPENQRQLQLLRGRVHRMEALINGLLDYSRVGRTQVATEMVDVRALLADIIDLLDPPAGFTITVAPDLPTFKTKRLLLSQVFSNLLSNAVKHHGSSTGEIIVSVEEQGKFYEFAVSDDGQGIAPEYHEKIFTIFQTLEARDVTENTGVGLSIVRKIIESEGGAIAVDSQVGNGTTFRFTWSKQPQST